MGSPDRNISHLFAAPAPDVARDPYPRYLTRAHHPVSYRHSTSCKPFAAQRSPPPPLQQLWVGGLKSKPCILHPLQKAFYNTLFSPRHTADDINPALPITINIIIPIV